MHKKLSKHGNSLALVIDSPILKLLKIDANTELELVVENGNLIIHPRRKTLDEKITKMENDERFKKALQEVIDDYAQAFEKLAK